ncbi:MAG: HD domain-containing protein, partial [Chitinivibrionales bacterium]|nr:HD domain-containing protein [Chitinivibrionales bacterium]
SMEKYLDERVNEIKRMVSEYIRGFYSSSHTDNAAFRLKKDHTERVAKEIISIAQSLQLDGENCILAEIIAYLHDIGRFRQFATYKTFVDKKSENHAEIGVREIKRNGFLKNLSAEWRTVAVNAVSIHNRAAIPENLDSKSLFFAKMLRDADKIDILHVVTSYYTGNNGVRNTALELDLPDTGSVSDDIYNDVMQRRVARSEKMRSLNDFKLLQMGWIFDLNFTRTFQIFKEREYLAKIYSVLPHTPKMQHLYNTVSTFLDRNSENEKLLQHL